MKISIILVLTFLNSCFVEKDQSSAIGERNKDHKLLLAADTDIPIDLVGRFERSCQKNVKLSSETERLSSREVFEIYPDRSLKSYSFVYFGDDCQEETLLFYMQNTYSNLRIDTLTKRRFIARYEIQSSELEFVFSSFNFDDLNKRQFCDYTDWQVGKAKSILSRQCFGGESSLVRGSLITEEFNIEDATLRKLHSFDFKSLSEGTTPRKKVSDGFLFKKASKPYKGKKRPEIWPIPLGLNFKHEKDRKLSFEPSLIGTFQGECKYPLQLENSQESFSSREFFFIDQYARARSLSLVYLGEDCLTYKEVYRTDIKFSHFAFTKLENNSYSGSFYVESVYLEPSTSLKLVSSLNDRRFCGFNDWQGGARKEISGKNCDKTIIPSKGASIPDLMILGRRNIQKSMSFNPLDKEKIYKRDKESLIQYKRISSLYAGSRYTKNEDGSKELDMKLPGVWLGKKVQTIKSGDVIHNYKKSFKFQQSSDGLQRVQLATLIADRPYHSRLSSNIYFDSFSDSSDFNYKFSRTLVNLCLDKAPDTKYSCAEQKSFGKCEVDFMLKDNSCARTCGRCQPLISYLNSNKICGYDQWKVGRNFIDGSACQENLRVLIPKAEEKYFDIQIVEGGVMFLSKLAAKINDNRPLEVSRDNGFEKYIDKNQWPLGKYVSPSIVSSEDPNLKTVEIMNLKSPTEGSYKTYIYVKYKGIWYKSFKIEFFFTYDMIVQKKDSEPVSYDMNMSFHKDSIGRAYSAYIGDQEVCGRNDWADTKEKIISGNKCHELPTPLPKIGDKAYTIIRFENNGTMQTAPSGISPSSRPSSFRNLNYQLKTQ